MKTVIINYRILDVGGIENYIVNMIEACHKAGYRIIWLCKKDAHVSPLYQGLMYNSQIVEIYPLTACQELNLRSINIRFTEDEDVAVISFNLIDFIRAFQLKKANPKRCIKTYYFIPHFTGPAIYPEQQFKFFEKPIQRYLSRIYEQWVKGGYLYFFSQKHIEALEKEYGFIVPAEHRKMVPSWNKKIPFDKVNAERRYEQKEFRIVAASRFDFPHKGFMIGLLREFPKIKKRHPESTLYLIGDGKGQSLLEGIRDGFDKSIIQDIHIVNSMPLDQLLAFYQTCKLSISVAGCATCGAKVGLITLPARHYVNECEVYGFLPESKGCILETKPGYPVQPYIDKVFSMTKDEYVQYSQMSYEAFPQRGPDEPEVLFASNNMKDTDALPNCDIFKLKWICLLKTILWHFSNYTHRRVENE